VFRRSDRKKASQDLAEAQESLDQARGDRIKQEGLLKQERESVAARLERLAQGNHLAELAFQAFTERYDEHP
jgi:hypothetical protein